MRLLAVVLLLVAANGCAVRQLALDGLGSALAEGGSVFASDDDPELVRAAAPFSLKLIEGLLVERPRHPGLLLAAARGFTQYAYAFVHLEAEEAEVHSLAQARVLEDRARRLYRRAREYGLRGLSLGPAQLGAREVELLYWTAAAWGGLVALSKDSPEALADLPAIRALIDRALALDASFDRGALHTFLIALDPPRAEEHFARAMALSEGAAAAALVALAEAVCVPQQRRREFEALLGQALRIDVDRETSIRLATLVAQRRARWLLSRAPQLFIE
jgi:hypothetical protein